MKLHHNRLISETAQHKNKDNPTAKPRGDAFRSLLRHELRPVLFLGLVAVATGLANCTSCGSCGEKASAAMAGQDRLPTGGF